MDPEQPEQRPRADDPGESGSDGPPPPDVHVRAVTAGRKASLVVVLVALAVVLVLIGSAFLPRWWAERVGDLVSGRFSVGILWGLFYGAFFTFVALMVLWQARRPRFGRRGRLVVVVVAVLLATPNLLTLGISLGIGDAAQEGGHILDVEAPGFRRATLIGALAGAAGAIAIGWTARTLRGRQHRIERLEQELHDRDAGSDDDPGRPPTPA